MIEHMSELIATLAQFIFILWPFFVTAALIYSLQGPGGKSWWKLLLLRIQKNLLITWFMLFLVWIVTLFANGPTPALLPEPFSTILFFFGLFLIVAIEVNRLRLFPVRLKARIDLQEAQAIDDLRKMDPSDFEELVAETYRALGNQAARTGKSGDHGIDVEVITPDGDHWVVQCKRYRDPVGEKFVRELYGTMISEKASRGILVTSAETTPPAESWAKGKPIDLIDGRRLLKMMKQARMRTESSIYDKIVAWFRKHTQTNQTPSGLRQDDKAAADDISLAQTQPTHVNRQDVKKTSEEIFCPRCGARMILHPRHPGRNLYRCGNYPNCKVILEGQQNL